MLHYVPKSCSNSLTIPAFKNIHLTPSSNLPSFRYQLFNILNHFPGKLKSFVLMGLFIQSACLDSFIHFAILSAFILKNIPDLQKP